MNKCLFCNKEGPFSSPEHIIPEALGNDDLILVEEVCDNCNQYFGKEIEKFVLGKTPFAFWRTYLGIRKKNGDTSSSLTNGVIRSNPPPIDILFVIP